MDKLERAAFREWLLSRPSTRVVGLAGNGGACPLATYLGPGWMVYGTHIRHWEAERNLILPPWARAFIAAVDTMPWYGPGIRQVFSREALDLLDGLAP